MVIAQSIAKWFINRIFPIHAFLSLACAMLVQGYLEKDRYKMHTAMVVITTIHTMDANQLCGDAFSSTMHSVYDIYHLTKDQIDDIIKIIQELNFQLELEYSSVNVLLQDQTNRNKEAEQEKKS